MLSSTKCLRNEVILMTATTRELRQHETHSLWLDHVSDCEWLVGAGGAVLPAFYFQACVFA